MNQLTLEPAKALNKALAAAQAEFPEIPRAKTVKTGTYEFSYAELGTILALVRPVLAKHGLSVTQPMDFNGNTIVLRTELRHEAGGQIQGTIPLRDQGTEQQFGSSATYRRRYALISMLGIAAEDDDDAAGAGADPASATFQAPVVDLLSASQRRNIWRLRNKLRDEKDLDEETFDKQLADDYGATISGLTKVQASELIERLKKAAGEE